MKERKRIVKTQPWPTVLRSMRKLHLKVPSRILCSNLSELYLSAFGNPGNDFDNESNASDDSDSLLHPESVTQDSDLEAEKRPEENCPFCQLPCGTARTTFRSVELGASAGNQCCVTISDAITTWGKHWQCKFGPRPFSEIIPENVSIRLWFGYDGDYPTTKSIIHLEWENVVDQKHDTCSKFLRLFQSQGAHPLTSNVDIVPLYDFPLHPLIAFDTSSLASARQIFDWLDECRRNHPYCRNGHLRTTEDPYSEHYMPKRILEISGHQLVLIENLASKRQYACLSHSWGPDGVPCQLKTSTLGALKQGISISALPKTFRDAVLICMRLGIRLIWIDALCIMQDSTSDWKEATATMADIYENGFITIAATASTDSNTGCFSDPRNPSWPKKLHNSTLHVMEHIPVASFHDYASLYGRCPLLRRAWVYQERLLSPRVIHFAACQLIWECKSMWKSQHGDFELDWTNGDCPRELKTWHVPFKRPEDNEIKSWEKILVAYTQLDITYFEDRLPALAAIVKRIMLSRPGDTYIAGLWRDSIIQNLLWLRVHTDKIYRPIPNIPTWSWACLPGAINLQPILGSKASVSSITIKEVGPPQLGNAFGAVISLQSHYCVATLVSDTICIHYKETGIEEFPTDHRLRVSFLFTRDFALAPGPQPLPESERIFVVFLGFRSRHFNWCGLVLRQVSLTKYERIGGFGTKKHFKGDNVRRKAKPTHDIEIRIQHTFVLSLPVGEFNII